MRNSPRRTERGFTLIETMTVVAVMALLVAVVAPGMQNMVANQRARAAAHDLISDLVLARSEAVKRNKDVVLNPNGGWIGGWEVMTALTSERISLRNPLAGQIQITQSPASITYDGAGRLSGAMSTVRFELFDGNKTYRCITVDPSGLPVSRTRACP